MTSIDQIYRALGLNGVKVAHGTRPGVKASGNEDAVTVSLPPENYPESGLLCAVADGVGGLSQGAAASNAAVGALASSYHAEYKGNPPAALRNAVLAAHDAVRQATAATDGNTAGATTLVAVVVQDNELWVANVGDSRAYLLGADGDISQITVDHSWIQAQIQAGTLTQEEAAVHPWRKVITSSLGGDATPEVDIFRRHLSAGEKVLLCSDGLTEVVKDEEIRGVLATSGPETAVTFLLKLADERAARDDVTICVIQPDLIDSPGVEAKRDTDTAEFPALKNRSSSIRPLRLLSRALLVMLITLTIGVGIAWAATEQRITPGVATSTGLRLGGMRPSDAANAVVSSMAPSLTCAMTMQVEGQRWTRTSSELGLWIDGDATAAIASSIGHNGPVRKQASERVDTALNGSVVDPVVRVNTQTLLWQLIVIANDFDRTSEKAIQIDVPRAMFMVNQQLLEQPCSQVELPTRLATGLQAHDYIGAGRLRVI